MLVFYLNILVHVKSLYIYTYTYIYIFLKWFINQVFGHKYVLHSHTCMEGWWDKNKVLRVKNVWWKLKNCCSQRRLFTHFYEFSLKFSLQSVCMRSARISYYNRQIAHFLTLKTICSILSAVTISLTLNM